MKKNLLSLLFIIAIACSSRAQYVTLPDSNWGIWLHNNGYAGCMTGNSTVGWRLDTTCNSVLSATSISCSNAHIHDLDGLQYFKNLTQILFRLQLFHLPAYTAAAAQKA